MAKTVIKYEVVVSLLNGRDTDIFIADKYKVQPDGLVKCEGTYRRKKRQQIMYFPLTSISSIEEYEVDSGAEVKEKEEV